MPQTARRWRTPALVLAPWLLIVAIWYAIAYSGLINPALLPKPHEVVARFSELARDRLPLDIWMSTQRVFIGVTLGIVLAEVSDRRVEVRVFHRGHRDQEVILQRAHRRAPGGLGCVS